MFNMVFATLLPTRAGVAARGLLVALVLSAAFPAAAAAPAARGEPKVPFVLSAEAAKFTFQTSEFHATDRVRVSARMTVVREETKWLPSQSVCLVGSQARKSVCVEFVVDEDGVPVLTLGKVVHDEERNERIEDEEIAEVALVDDDIVIDAGVRDGVAHFVVDGLLAVTHKMDFVPDRIRVLCASADCKFAKTDLAQDHPLTGEDDGELLAAAAVVERAEKKYGYEVPFLAWLRLNLADKLEPAGKLERAMAECQQALALAERHHGREHLLVGRALRSLADVYVKQGKYAQAEPLYLRSISIYEKNAPDGNVLPSVLNQLGLLYNEQRRDKEALAAYERALILHEAVDGPDHSRTVTVRHNIALMHAHSGRHDEAIRLLKLVLAARERTHGTDHIEVADALATLGYVYGEAGDEKSAEPYLRRALAMRESQLGKHHPSVATSVTNLGVTLQVLGDTVGAIEAYRRGLEIRELVLGRNHIDVANSLKVIGGFYKKQKMWDEAEPLLRRALAIEKASFADDHPEVQFTRSLLRELAFERGLAGNR